MKRNCIFLCDAIRKLNLFRAAKIVCWLCVVWRWNAKACYNCKTEVVFAMGHAGHCL